MKLRRPHATLLVCVMFAVIACHAIPRAIAEQLSEPAAESVPLKSDPADSGWQLTRIRSPRDGPNTISIMHSADISQSDIGLAGLVFRCQAAPDVDTMVIVTEPWPPSSHPTVTLHIGTKIAKFEASVLEPFTALLLAPGATAFLTASSQIGPSVSISVEGETKGTSGTVPTAGFGPAFDDLLKSCLAP